MENIKNILEQHCLFLKNNTQGKCANLSNANLSNVNLIIFNKPLGRTCYAINHITHYMITCGCFWGTIDEFEVKCKESHPNNPIEAYEKQIAYLRSLK